MTFAAAPYSVSQHMGGLGVRIWELAQVLADEFDVSILVDAESDLAHEGVDFAAGRDSWASAIADADAVFFNDLAEPALLLEAHENGKLIVSEAAPPLEHLFYSAVHEDIDPERRYQEILDAFRLQVLVTDHFIVRSAVERASMLGVLASLGRVSYETFGDAAMGDLISLVPIGFNRFSEAHALEAPYSDPVDFIWNGGIWDYFDAASVASAAAGAHAANDPVSVLFLYPPPIDQVIAEPNRLREQISSHEMDSFLHVNPESPAHYDRDGFLKAAKAIICLAKDGIENQTCVRLRLRDLFLYRLPVIVDGFGGSGQLVRALGVGIAVNPGNITDVSTTLSMLARDDNLRDRLVRKIDECRDAYRVENNVASVRLFLEAGRRASDRRSQRISDAIGRLLDHAPRLANSYVSPI